MLGYVTLGTNDFDKAVNFYDKLLGEIGGKRFMETERSVVWSFGEGKGGFSVIKPYDKKPATIGNGTMIALKLESNDEVDRMYKKALELGAVDEGESGLRGGTFYAGYFRDLDGNKLNFYNM